MEKYRIYFLSLILLFIVVGCVEDRTIRYHQLNRYERDLLAKEFEAKNDRHFSGSVKDDILLDTLIRINPFNAEYYREKAMGFTRRGDFHKSFPLLEKAAKLNPKEILYNYSWYLLYDFHDYERALHYLNEFDNFTPDTPDYPGGKNINFLKGLSLKGLGRHREAIQEFTNCIEFEGIRKVDLYVFVYRGISYTQLGDLENAIKDFDQAIELFQRCTMAYYYKGVALEELAKDDQGAISNYLHALDLIQQGYKLSNPYDEVFDEVYLEMIEDRMAALK